MINLPAGVSRALAWDTRDLGAAARFRDSWLGSLVGGLAHDVARQTLWQGPLLAGLTCEESDRSWQDHRPFR
ncbi:hypothetical protein, partial [Cellulosimicrobium composti]|uniref:hypothetical protein n=1 Tax=Cellulosimicrobium composti TaxID=2672572 RepID=UPI0037A3665C